MPPRATARIQRNWSVVQFQHQIYLAPQHQFSRNLWNYKGLGGRRGLVGAIDTPLKNPI
ncbi:hypothetical protein AVDCRST_MAG84-169 [uncultured Microcoleus sp.]|uniref:Uncharacterized protein n=1 Tax=uncultured Microcoleus sp. TaxID=259945 RepID=A0A6J4KEW4_9CYAN|nr:hypothetical protein AVDCRST_MAG84-169 [uncultured Microcoleus sp.]